MGFENGKLVRVVLRASAGTQEQVNVFHYDLIDSGPSTNSNSPQTLADLFRDNVVPAFKALYVASWTVDPVIVTQEKDPQNPNAGRQQWQSGTSQPGSRTIPSSEGLAGALCGVCTLKTEHVGRRHTGRIFLGGNLFEGDVAGNAWTTGWIASWQAYVNTIPHQPDLISGPDPGSAHWCVYSRTQRGQDFDPYASAVTTPIIRSKVHWLRSRDG